MLAHLIKSSSLENYYCSEMSFNFASHILVMTVFSFYADNKATTCVRVIKEL